MSSRTYSIVEPHPNPSPSAHYMSTGRGGAGNAIRTTSLITRGADATGPASAAQAAQAIRTSLSSNPTKHTTSPTTYAPSTVSSSSQRHGYSMGGRGGAGNVFPASERAIFSFDEELERQLRWERDVAPVYHVGRGGAGNLIHTTTTTSSFAGGEKMIPRRRPSEDSGASMASSSSHGSESGADAFNRTMKKGWKKFTGAY